MEHIDGGIVRHGFLCILKRRQQEIIEGGVLHVVILDLPGAALVVDIVGRVGDDEVCFAAVHEGGECLFLGAVTANEPVPPQRPDVTGLREGRLLQFGIHIEIVISGFNAIVKQLRQFLFIKASKERVKVRCLQRLNFHTQEFFVPARVHRHTVVRNNVGFLLRFGEVVGKNARHLIDAFLLGSKNTTVTGNDAIVTVDDNGIDEAELSQRRAELVDLLRRMGTGIVHIGNEFADGDEFHFGGRFHQTSPHSANFSKPPTDWM